MKWKLVIVAVAMMVLLSGIVRAQAVATKDIFVAGRASATYGLGCDGRYLDGTQGVFRCQTLTEGGQTFIRMEYLGGSAAVWGAFFITVGGDPRGWRGRGPCFPRRSSAGGS